MAASALATPRRRPRRSTVRWRLQRLHRLSTQAKLARRESQKRPREAEAVVEEPRAKRPAVDLVAAAAALLAAQKKRGNQDGEPSREEVPLRLLGEEATGSLALATNWSYPVQDEAWRCFGGYLPGAVPAPQRKRFFDAVRAGTTWLQPEGRWGPLPLRTAWMTTAPCTCKYRYGGAEVVPETFPQWMQDIMATCMPLCGLLRPDEWPNSCNLNLYEDGQQSVGWHADNESLFQGKVRDCPIISLSLGQTRTFELKCRGSNHKMKLEDGDLCTMEGLTQKHFQHRVGKEGGKNIGPRINLTWRWVVEHMKECGCAA